MNTISIGIDIGNTAIKAGVFENDQVQTIFQFEELEGLQQWAFNLPNDTSIIISSVTNHSLETFSRYFSKLIFLDYNTKVPIIKNYNTPQTLGNDRLAAAVGSYKLYPKSNCLVIDAGTAIKYDFLDEIATYHGGSIAPGIDMKFKALNQFTSKLPLIQKSNSIHKSGLSTDESILSGVMFGTLMEMQGFIDTYTKAYKNLKVILTGGDHPYFEGKLKGTIFAEPNLVLIGLNEILNHNAL